MKSFKTTFRTWTMNAAITLASIVASLVALEILVRLITPGVGFVWRNFATDPINMVRSNQFVRFDSTLGFVHVGNRPDLGLGPIGNRLHVVPKPNEPAPPIPPDAILALGDSFTFGSEVGPAQSWPAYLEDILKVPVVNAGIGGFGIDQMVLFGERLVPELKPKLILLSFIPPDIDRNKMSIYSGAAKPYFTAEDGKLVPHNLPVPRYQPKTEYVGRLRAYLGYSYLINWTAARLGLLNQWQLSKWEFHYEKSVDDVAVGCLLMKRLKALGNANKTPVVVIGQYGWSHFIPAGYPPVEDERKVLACARNEGMAVVDTYDDLRARLPSSREGDFSRYFVNGVGHMTPEGNKLIAELIAKSITSIQ